MPFMDEPPGSKVSTRGSKVYGGAIRRLRSITKDTLNKEPRWRTKGRDLRTGFTKTW
jgi:hydrogenase small subunit